MKCFVVIVAVAIVVATVSCQEKEVQDILDHYDAAGKPSEEFCIKASKADPDMAKNLIIRGEFPDIKELQCYTKCLFEKAGIINSNNEVVPEVLRKNVGVTDKVLAEKIFATCKDIKKSNLCETSYEISKCIYKGAVEAGNKA